MRLTGVKWDPMWTTLLGCTRGCLNYIGVEVSVPWLFGATGHGFLVNFGESTCPSHPTAWQHSRSLQLAENAGFRCMGIWGDDGELAVQQKRAWDACRESIDAGRPCLAWAMDIPEWYIVDGYDDEGYLYVGVNADDGAGPRSWRESDGLGRVPIAPCEPSDAEKTGRDALEYAIELDEQPAKWTYEDRRTGMNGYKNWRDSARALPDTGDEGHGLAYNAMVWAECRKNAVGFLSEAKQQLNGHATEAFDAAISSYSNVANHLQKVTELFPFSPPSWDENARDKKLVGKVVDELLAARDAEYAGLSAMKHILDTL